MDETLAAISRLVSEKDAQTVRFTETKNTRFAELIRTWKADDRVQALQGAIYLADHTSSSNGQSEQQWVDNPIGSNQEHPGRYRQVSVMLTKQGESPGIVQTLRLGFLQQLPATEDVDDEARLRQLSRDPNTGMLRITRAWLNIDPDFLQVIEAAKATITQVVNPQCEVFDVETDPYTEQKVYPGLFQVVSREASPTQEDGSCILTEVLQQITQATSLSVLAALTPDIITQGNEIRDLFSVATGDAYTIALRYTNLSSDSRAYCMGENAANLQTLVATGDFPSWATAIAYAAGQRVIQSGTRYICIVAHTSGTFLTDLLAGKWLPLVGWTYADAKFQKTQEGIGVFSVELRMERWNEGYSETDAVIVAASSNIDWKQRSLTRVWLRRTRTARNRLIMDFPAWITGTSYNANYAVMAVNTSPAGTFAYGCVVAHTAGTFTTDLVAGKWVLITNSGAPIWSTASSYIVGQSVNQGGLTYVCIVAHQSGVFATDLAAGKWQIVNTSQTGGAALTGTVYQGFTLLYDHFTASEIEGGGWNVTEHLVIPSFLVTKPNDITVSHLVKAYQEMIYLNDPEVLEGCLVEEFEAQFNNTTDAYSYADKSSFYWDGMQQGVPTKRDAGLVRYAGSGIWIARCVLMQSRIAGTWPTPSNPP